MAQKRQEKGFTGPAPVASGPDQVRNVVLVGHSGAGKTTLIEALLAAAGAISRPGSVAEGTTVCDHDPAAVRQQRSVGLAAASIMYEGTKINLIDTPGYADFLGEVRAGLRAADAALFVVSAADGVDEATAALWEECAAVGMPRAVAVTWLDHARADVDETVAICREAFGDEVLPLYLPLHGDDESVVGLLGLISQRLFDYSQGSPPAVREPDPEHLRAMAEARNELIEGIIAESEDETLLERYLGGETLAESVLIDDLETAVARGTFHPVIPVCAPTGVGLDSLLTMLARAFPTPGEHPLPVVTALDGSPRETLTADPAGPLAAQVVKTTIDPYVGRVSLVRVFSGTLRPESTVHIAGHDMAARGREDHDADERVAHIYAPLGTGLREISECFAGDLCAITKSHSAETGDTISAKDDPLLVTPWEIPEPLLPVAVVAQTRSDEEALAKALGRLVSGDPTVRLERNPETRQQVLWCLGEAHADVVLERLRAGGAAVETEPVRVALRETFTSTATGHGRHVKQSGGHGQYAICDLRVEPLPPGTGYEFASEVVGGAVPSNYIPSVDKGVRAQLARGLVAGHPVVDIRVVVYDGKAHSVDSSDAAFQTAGSLALKEAAAAGELALLEPIDEVTIRIPEAYVGTIMGDLSGRRGRVQGTEADPEHGDQTLIHAEVPALELLRFLVELRAMTSGTGSFTRRFARYDAMPAHVADQVRKDHAAAG
ncbi:elongation factor G-like protein EF-G2 [Natronosporangium hydrolyticum]|uniref:Elongation factor G-like protein EF-G2 n=1 Tax=Natronosporangium hydrolyticum TaxID=2811111 RepID=A0A895YHA3_9ACTN|nr:elongation factor G-like protein EF-G2 [Natronosporangium hydrolyticum]QSB16921.1 elongation factor G-like protein EF-G2 [Natronosporangium hydrolyticum]